MRAPAPLLPLLAALLWPAAGLAWRLEIPGDRTLHSTARAVAVDATGDVLAAGEIERGPGFDGMFVVVKLDGGTGAELWRRELDGAGDAVAQDVAVDQSGDVVAVGRIDGAFSVVKLAGGTGADVWRRDLVDTDTVCGDGTVALTVAVDAGGDVLAGGILCNAGTGSDAVVVRLAGTTGAELWRATVDGSWPSSTEFVADRITDVLLDGAGDVLAVGFLQDSLHLDELLVWKLAGATGNELWRREIGTLGNDRGLTGAVDALGDVVAAGSMGADNFGVFKLNGGTGAELWRTLIDGPGAGFNSAAHAVAVDAAGDVVAAGMLRKDGQAGNIGDTDVVVVKLDGGNGAELWRYEPRGPKTDEAWDVAIDGAGDVVVAAVHDGRYLDFAVHKLDGGSGVPLWRVQLDGTTRARDEAAASSREDALALAIAPSGDVVAGGALANDVAGTPIEHFAVVHLDGATGAVGPLHGAALVVTDDASAPGLLSIAAGITDLGFVTPPPGSADDPRTAGATLRLLNPTTLEAASLVLPAGPAWTGIGNPPGSRGYRYRDPAGVQGPCRVLLARPGRNSRIGKMRATCTAAGGPIPFTLDEPAQGALAVSVRFGSGAPQCATFGGRIGRDVGLGSAAIAAFDSRDAPALAGDCP